MGAGQGWASVILKNKYPNSYVVATDLVPGALNFCRNYEKLLNSYIDEKWAFNCRDIPFEDNQSVLSNFYNGSIPSFWRK